MSTNGTAPSSTSAPGAAAPLITPARIIAAVCVIAPFVSVLWVPIYDKPDPEAGGFPFFFWWQLLWVVITALLMAVAYYVVRREEVARRGSGPAAAATATATESVAGGDSGERTSARGAFESKPAPEPPAAADGQAGAGSDEEAGE